MPCGYKEKCGARGAGNASVWRGLHARRFRGGAGNDATRGRHRGCAGKQGRVVLAYVAASAARAEKLSDSVTRSETACLRNSLISGTVAMALSISGLEPCA